MAKPLWATPERQRYLAELHSTYGNRCLLGHATCPDLSHYVEEVPTRLAYPIVERKRCEDRQGNVIRDRQGEALFTESYKVGYEVIPIPRLNTLYDRVIDEMVADWRRDDAEARRYSRELEGRAMHRLPERGALRGHFNAISRTIFFDNQPMFEILGLGVSGLTFKPYAKVRLASSIVALQVDVSEALAPLSKNRRRKSIRYNRPLPATIEAVVSETCSRAIAHYLSK